ncbi:hypothetical protein P3L51_35595 [Streptomyces sp. PSRA5]|uniref:hypothetical protein n=1 Tax=Streptomyces panacea TaxID=3035064 RepID=UPI00339C3316
MESVPTPRPTPQTMARHRPGPEPARHEAEQKQQPVLRPEQVLPEVPPAARPAPWIRAEWEAALVHSGLHPFARLTALVLARYAAHHSGVIGAGGDVPPVGRIATATGLHADRAGTSLRVLEALGWVRRERPPGRHRPRTEWPMRLTTPVTAYVSSPRRPRPDRTADSRAGGHDHHAP